MSDIDTNYLGAVLEEIRDQNKAVLEAVGQMQDSIIKIPKIASEVEGLKQDVKTIKSVVKDISKQQLHQENRLIALEHI